MCPVQKEIKEFKRTEVCFRGDTLTLEDFYLKELSMLIRELNSFLLIFKMSLTCLL